MRIGDEVLNFFFRFANRFVANVPKLERDVWLDFPKNYVWNNKFLFMHYNIESETIFTSVNTWVCGGGGWETKEVKVWDVR